MTDTTNSGVSNDASLTIDDAADAFMSRWTDAEKPSEEEKKEPEVPKETEAEDADHEDDQETDTDEDAEADDADESTDDESNEDEDSDDATADEDSEEDAKPVKKELSDDDEVEITVDKEKRKVPVKELKRLYGQEQALTKKSQEVAAQRKAVEAQAQKHAAVLDQLHQRAQAKWEPYSKLDMLIASKELDSETFAALRAEAQSAYEEFQFVSIEADRFMQQAQARQQETVKTQAAEAVKVLKEKIPNWSNELYDKLRSYAVDNGFDPEVTARITDPSAIMMLHKARMFDEGKKIKLKPKAKVPSKVIKSSNTGATEMKPTKQNEALKRLRSSGNVEDAADAFMARWAE